MNESTTIKSGVYFIHPEGSAWIAVRFDEDGDLVGQAYEADAGTHQAASDSWAGIAPQESDEELDADDADSIIRAVFGDDANVEMYVVSRALPVYSYEMHSEGGGDETVECGTDRPDDDDMESATEEWVKGGEWGENGARVDAWWVLNEDGEEIDRGSVTVEIEPDHESLIRAACSNEEWDRCCGGDPDDHDWTSEGEGGCTENPGVWSTGGTSMSFASHCKKCGLHLDEHSTGSQCNPGEHDTVSYEMPEEWCAECEKQECSCEPVELWYTTDDEDGDEVEFSISLPPAKAEDDDAIEAAIDAVCRENKYDRESVQD